MNQTTETAPKPKRINPWQLAALVVIGTIWGMSELLGGETLRLTATALVLLAVARVVLNLPGTSLALAGIAVLFRSVNAAPFHCHLAGIALLGAAFDLTATLFLRGGRMGFIRSAMTGAMTAYLSAFLFASAMVWVFEFRSWPEGGIGRVGEHLLYSGSRAALAGVFAVPLGVWLGRELTRVASRYPRGILAATASGCAALWVAGVFVG